MINHAFWKNKRVLVTGHSGFKGAWLCLLLSTFGARVTGFARNCMPRPTLFDTLALSKDILAIEGDVRDAEKVARTIREFQPDVVFHLAAQALVLESIRAPQETFDINVNGTVNIIDAVRDYDRPIGLVLVTSDKVYKNTGALRLFTEDDELGGKDPYSASKACAELAIASMRDTYFPIQDYGKTHRVVLASVRAGNVIGGGDRAENRVVPDIFRAVQTGKPIVLRRPDATRPWQHVFGALQGYLLLAQHLYGNAGFSGAWNFGPEPDHIIPVGELVERFRAKMPERLRVEIKADAQNLESTNLGLDISKAKKALGYKPRWNLARTLDETHAWYEHFLADASGIADFSRAQADEYFRA